MQIVIDVNKETYSDIMYRSTNTPWDMDAYDWLIADGTPLPENHGNLKDEMEIIKSLFAYVHGKKTIGQCLDDVPILIKSTWQKVSGNG